MGASVSSSSSSTATVTQMESADAGGEPQKMTAEEMQLLQIQNMPKYSRPETFEEKLYRKVRDGVNVWTFERMNAWTLVVLVIHYLL